jgi:hypothetical protein
MAAGIIFADNPVRILFNDGTLCCVITQKNVEINAKV